MRKKMPEQFCLALLVLVGSLALTACGPTSALALVGAAGTPTPLPPSATNVPPLGATPTPAETATQMPATATATRRPATPTVRATATPVPPQSVFVTEIKVDRPTARSNEAPQFTATFLNTTGQMKTYRWFVKVYAPDDPSRSFGETSKVDSVLPINTTQLKSSSDWKTQSFFDCLSFVARVFWVDGENQVHEFQKLDGSNPAIPFTVCP
jgi:hypothetical protein